MTTNEKAGIALILGSIALFVTMGFHPTGRDVLVASTNGGTNTLNTSVHALAIAAEALTLLGTLALTLRLLGQRELAVSAFAVYALAVIALMIAAVASGLIASGVAARAAGAQGTARDVMMATFQFTFQMNQAFAKVGFSLASLAIILWSAAMIRNGFSRALGLYGIMLGAIVLVGLSVGRLRLNVHGFGGVVMVGHSAWMIWAGLLLRRVA